MVLVALSPGEGVCSDLILIHCVAVSSCLIGLGASIFSTGDDGANDMNEFEEGEGLFGPSPCLPCTFDTRNALVMVAGRVDTLPVTLAVVMPLPLPLVSDFLAVDFETPLPLPRLLLRLLEVEVDGLARPG